MTVSDQLLHSRLQGRASLGPFELLRRFYEILHSESQILWSRGEKRNRTGHEWKEEDQVVLKRFYRFIWDYIPLLRDTVRLA